ncbi:DUF4401 domain-containing protein [Pontibacter russatus]|uniref:DUF4401 domain-containing protein n=1 Tax=Pontibacter russatus TaxID=2694929 RepID=UPI001379CCBC|nr:DUF4401 domain-containing protein [Pontibacter russatus]
MENTEPLDTLLRQLRETEGETFIYDRARIDEEVKQRTPLLANLPVKLLTIFGGILASLFLLGFLLATGLYDSPVGMLVTGLLLLAGSVVVLRLRNDIMVETSCVSFHIFGYFLFSLGFSELVQNEPALYMLLALIALGVLYTAVNSIFTFLAVLVFCGSLAAIILDLGAYNLLHGYIGIVAGLLTYMSLREAALISQRPWFSRLYGPVRMGLVVTLVAALALLVHQRLASANITHYWLSGLLLVAAVLLVVSKAVRQAGLANRRQQVLVYACCGLVLAPTVLSPAVPGALLVMLTSFYIGHRTSFIIGLLALIYFVILYYYDLQFTLLQKSGLLVLTGALFTGGYLLLQKHLKGYEN